MRTTDELAAAAEADGPAWQGFVSALMVHLVDPVPLHVERAAADPRLLAEVAEPGSCRSVQGRDAGECSLSIRGARRRQGGVRSGSWDRW